MNTTISTNKVWTSRINGRAEILSKFDHQKIIRFYDTTLRDGEQSAGVCFTPDEKYEIACLLSDMGVSRIECGFPRVSDADNVAAKRIIDAGLNAQIWGFSRCVRGDIDAHIELGTENILVEISTSELKMKAYGFTREKVKDYVAASIEYAKSNGINKVNFFAVDATRSNLAFLEEVYSTAIAAGADEITVVDTIGACSPEAVEWLIRAVKSWVGGVPLHWHGHNDFGLATASAIAAVRGGAEWIQGTVNGMGERAGNADIAEVALALKYLYHVPAMLDLTKARSVSKAVQQAGGYTVDGWKPVVGEYLFTRESGAVAAQFQMPEAIEPYSADLVSAKRRIVLGKKSGLASIDLKSKDLGIEIPTDVRAAILAEVKELSVKKSGLVSDEEFKAIVSRHV
jgi:isopropylmalate/homocitrate/citramalate synthase